MSRIPTSLAIVFVAFSHVVSSQTPTAASQEAKDTVEREAKQLPVLLQQVTVTATRTAEQIGNISQFVTVLKPEAIEQRQARTPNMMLREEPGIWTAQEAQ